MDLEIITNVFRETFEAFSADGGRIIGLFLFPLIAIGAVTAAQFTIVINANGQTFLQVLSQSGVCNTSIIPYTIFSTFLDNGVYAYCQAAQFSPLIFIAWYLQVIAIMFFVVLIYQAIFHTG